MATRPPDIIDVSRETLLLARERCRQHGARYEEYLNQLMWWNERVNLVSREVSRETLREHLVHSLMVIPLSLLKCSQKWVDAGTGGGLPGIPLAIAEPDRGWLLNDLVGKKIAAVRQMAHRLSLNNVSLRTGSIEDLEFDPGCGVVTKHAFPATELLSMLDGKTWIRILMFKGAEEALSEAKQLPAPFRATLYRFDFGESEPFYLNKGILMVEPV